VLETAQGQPATVDGDRNLLFQCVANLLDNAIKFSPQGGVVRVGHRYVGSAVEISVSDQGPGIAEDQKPRVLERFYRVEVSRSAPGSGLGLSLAAAIAKLHGATLALEDNRPGLRVVLRLPAERVRPARPALPAGGSAAA
jgi:signal transduction histidine kinase